MYRVTWRYDLYIRHICWNCPPEKWNGPRSWASRVNELNHRKKIPVIRIPFNSLNQKLHGHSQSREDGNALAKYVRMVESHMRTRRGPRLPLLPSSTPWQPSRKLSFLLTPFLSCSPLSLALSPCPRYPFCLCKARASKVVSSAFGRLIALAYSTKFGRAVPLSGTTQEFSLCLLADRAPLIHLNARWMPSLSERRCTWRTTDGPHYRQKALKDCLVITTVCYRIRWYNLPTTEVDIRSRGS